MKNVAIHSGMPIKGRLTFELFGPDGVRKEIREIDNTITELGDAHVADQLEDAPAHAQTGFMNIGTTSGGKAANSTGLEAALTGVALTSTTKGVGGDDNDLIFVATWGAGVSTGAIVEAGIFRLNDNATLQCWADFAVVNKLAADAMTITWTWTLGAS